MKIYIVILFILMMLPLASASTNWIKDGNSVYIDDSKAYINANPHTLDSSGWITFNIISKQYTGDVDIAFGFDKESITPTSAERWNGNSWVNFANKFDSVDWQYDGFNKWYYSTNLPVVAGNTYIIRVYMDIQTPIGGKYGFAIKPSFQTLEESKNAGNLYYLDPWWNSSWTYRIDNAISNGVRPYQISLNLSNSTGTNNATTIFCNGNCNTNFTDVRFTLNNVTLLPYWIENNATGKTWVNVTGNGTVSIYYGNRNALYISNGSTTFPLFDDFNNGTTLDTTKWTLTQSGGTFSIHDSVADFTLDVQNNINIVSKANVPNTSMAFFYKYSGYGNPSDNGGSNAIGTKITNTSMVMNERRYTCCAHPTWNDLTRMEITGQTYEDDVTLTTSFQDSKAEIRKFGSTVTFLKNDIIVLNGTHTDSITLPTNAYVGMVGGDTTNGNILYMKVDYVGIRNYVFPEIQWATWNTQMSSSWSNNVTNDNSLVIQTLTTKTVGFNFTVPTATTYKWWYDGTVQGSTTNLHNQTFSTTGTHYVNVSAINENVSNNWTVNVYTYNLEAMLPINGSTSVSNPVSFLWREWTTDAPYTLYIYTDNQYINLVSSSIISSGTDENFSKIVSLDSNTQYFWRVKNNSNYYTNLMNFTTILTVATPGSLNLTVYDEQNLSKQILNYTAYAYNSTSVITKNSNTVTGWANFSTELLGNSEYLIIVVPNGTYSNYVQRMVLSTNPGSLIMYVPNGTAPNTIYTVAFSLLDVTGLFPFQTSTITISKGGLVQDKSYFGADGTHPVYLIGGQNYQIIIQNGNSIQSFGNYVPLASGTSQITINDFTVNTTQLNPFLYNITYDTSQIILNWNDVGSVMNTLSFNVDKGVTRTDLCQLTTTIKHGQSVCSIVNLSDIYYVDFSAKMNDGTFQNQSIVVDYRIGTRPDNTGYSTIDGSPIGIGFKWDYGTWHTPDWVYNVLSIIFFVLLAGTFGAQFSGIGSIILGIIMLLFESFGWFAPIKSVDPQNYITIGLTGALTILAILYYLQSKDRGQ